MCWAGASVTLVGTVNGGGNQRKKFKLRENGRVCRLGHNYGLGSPETLSLKFLFIRLYWRMFLGSEGSTTGQREK